jgi:WD40 repeat protein
MALGVLCVLLAGGLALWWNRPGTREEEEEPPAPPAVEPPGRVRAFLGHQQAVSCVAWLGDGEQAISGSEDATLRIWKVSSGEETLCLRGHRGGVLCVAVSPDGGAILSGSRDGTVRLWNAKTGREDRQMEQVSDPCWGLTFARDGREALCCSEGRGVKRYAVETGKLLAHYQGAWANTVAHTATQPGWFLSGGEGGKVLLWSWDRPADPPRRLPGHTGWIRQVAVSADGKRAASVSGNTGIAGANPAPDNDSTVICRALPAGNVLARFTAHRNTVTSVTLTATGDRVLSGSTDGTARLFDMDGKKELIAFQAHPMVFGVALLPDGRLALTCGSDRRLVLWRLP